MAAIKLAIEIVGNILAQRAGYGIFRDEMYYLICGRHLAFGYVDQPPMVALQARLSEILFGYDHMWSLRLISGLAGAFKVFLTGALVWAMGGSRRAAALAMLGVITVAGVYLGADSFLSMNSFEPVFWLPCALALIRIAQAETLPDPERIVRNWWIVLGVSAGLGLENKANEVFFLVAVLIALVLTPQRRILASRWFGVAVAIMVALALPNLLWQIHNHWPTLEWLIGISKSNKDVKLPPLTIPGGPDDDADSVDMSVPVAERSGVAAGEQNSAAVPVSGRAVSGLPSDDDAAACEGLLPGAGVSDLLRSGRDALASGGE
jgi:hypothetical protein